MQAQKEQVQKEKAAAQPAVKKRATPTPVRHLARTAVDAIQGKKGHDVTVLDMRKVSGVADFFVVCTGDSDLQIRAIVDAVETQIREAYGEKPWHREGVEHMQWVLLDYVDLVVHVFSPEKRLFYGIERLWGDAPTEQVADDAGGEAVALLRGDAPAEPTAGER